MCGICGTTNARDTKKLAAMNAALWHRGPDDDGMYVDERAGVGLAARRLSIIDVEGGHQPLCNEDRTIWAVQNGEIYNFPALRERMLEAGHVFSTRTDTEILVHLYEEYGPELVHALEGMYAFALWDTREEVLLLARDRFGEKPLFVSELGGPLSFASELTALTKGLPAGLELDPEALDDYFVHGYVNAPRSVVRGITQLPPGHMLRWSRSTGASSVRSYWAPPAMPDADSGSRAELVGETRRLLEASIRGRLLADVPLGVFLSGGCDSTLVTALAAREAGRRVKSFTIGYDVGSVNETAAAADAARLIGTEHHELILDGEQVAARAPEFLAALDQPLADQAFVPVRMLSEFARGEVKVIVGGEGADELFGGYPRYRWLARAARIPSALPRAPLLAAAGLVASVPGLERASRLRDVLVERSPLERHIAWVTGLRPQYRSALYGPRLAGLAGRAGWLDGEAATLNDGPSPSVEAAFMQLDQRHWLPGDVLAKADRASMQTSLELRTPFLSRELAEFAMSVPASVHVSGRGKPLLRGVLDEVLPDGWSDRAKTAFRAPAASWLRGPLAPLLDEQLRTGLLYAEGWFDRAAVERLVREHESGAQDRSSVLWPLFALGVWLDRFGDARV